MFYIYEMRSTLAFDACDPDRCFDTDLKHPMLFDGMDCLDAPGQLPAGSCEASNIWTQGNQSITNRP